MNGGILIQQFLTQAIIPYLARLPENGAKGYVVLVVTKVGVIKMNQAEKGFNFLDLQPNLMQLFFLLTSREMVQ